MNTDVTTTCELLRRAASSLRALAMTAAHLRVVHTPTEAQLRRARANRIEAAVSCAALADAAGREEWDTSTIADAVGHFALAGECEPVDLMADAEWFDALADVRDAAEWVRLAA